MALPQLKQLQLGATLQHSLVVLSTKASEEGTEERRKEEADQPKSTINLGNHIFNVISTVSLALQERFPIGILYRTKFEFRSSFKLLAYEINEIDVY